MSSIRICGLFVNCQVVTLPHCLCTLEMHSSFTVVFCILLHKGSCFSPLVQKSDLYIVFKSLISMVS